MSESTTSTSADGGLDRNRLYPSSGASQLRPSDGGTDDSGGKTNLLCSSCDRCRAKKIKCDGERPCGACKLSYVRKNVEEVGLTRVACVYSLAKMRGPPSVPASKRKNSVNGSSKEKKERAPHSKKQRSHADEDQVVGLWPLPTEASSTTSATAAVANTTNTNIDTISILNFLGMMNPTNSTLISSNMLQNQHQEGTSLTRSPLDPISAALQQPAFCIPAIAMAKGLAGGVPINWAHDITHASSNTKQPFAYSQQLLQELLQPQSAQQQLQPQSAQQQQSQQSQVHQELLHPSVQQQQLLPQPSAQQQQLQQSQVLQKLLQELLQPPAQQQQLLLQPPAQQQQLLLQPPAQQQQLLLQPPAQQQLLQALAQHFFPTSTESTATQTKEESPLSSSEEDGRTILSLQIELKQLRRRMNDLEAENARMKQIIELFQMQRE